MKVYVVSCFGYDDYSIDYVFLDKKLAEETSRRMKLSLDEVEISTELPEMAIRASEHSMAIAAAQLKAEVRALRDARNPQ